MAADTGRPTIRTVAQRAGVSKSLVSLVLQGSPKVSAAKRAAVETAIEELGYRPSIVARTLSSRRTGVLGVVMHDLRNPWFVDCLEGLAATAGAHGYRAMLADDRLDGGVQGSLVETMLDLHVDGLVLMGTMSPSPALRAAARARPTVVAASRDFHEPHVDVVANDDDAGTRLAVGHLLDLGHRDIAHLAGDTGAVPAIRRRAYLDAMRQAGLPARVVDGDMTEPGGHAAARRLLADAATRPTAVFAANDAMAIGVLAAARELGVRVPVDLSVVGYDNTALAGLGLIALTSVDNASHTVGELAAQALLARLEDPQAAASERLVPPSLVVRDSTSVAPQSSSR